MGEIPDVFINIFKHSMYQGTIKMKSERGFGFITREGEAKDIFFHSNDLVGVTFKELQIGAKVTFDIENGEKGPGAKNVKLA